ncbi:MAG: hypothetical protein U9Q40_00310 [Campylobacterota bacterium]|nr:hypothetical protein [Campylobacterota bacterium]
MEALNQIQPMPIIVSPREERFNEDIYEASNGNLINSKDGGLALTPQGETNLDSKKEQNAAEAEAQSQAQKDQTRANATDYLAHKSMQSQVEIYLAVATNGKVDIGSDSTPSIIESLRDVQKQNSVVEAYATYEENQKSVISQ